MPARCNNLTSNAVYALKNGFLTGSLSGDL